MIFETPSAVTVSFTEVQIFAITNLPGSIMQVTFENTGTIRSTASLTLYIKSSVNDPRWHVYIPSAAFAGPENDILLFTENGTGSSVGKFANTIPPGESRTIKVDLKGAYAVRATATASGGSTTMKAYGNITKS